MARVDFELKDSRGVNANIHDIIIVTIPYIELVNRWGDIYYYRPQIKAEAKIYMPPSKGLQIKIIKILDTFSNYEEEDIDKTKDGEIAIFDHGPEIGKRISFRYKTWKWELKQECK